MRTIDIKWTRYSDDMDITNGVKTPSTDNGDSVTLEARAGYSMLRGRHFFSIVQRGGGRLKREYGFPTTEAAKDAAELSLTRIYRVLSE